MSAVEPADRLPEGVASFAPLGDLVVDEVLGLVQCHACGRWLRQLHHSHLRTHGLTTDTYRRRFGLRAGHPLQAPDLVDLRRQGMRRQLAQDARVRQALADAQSRVRSGELVERARIVNTGVARRLETKRRIAATLRAARPQRERSARAERQQRAVALGFSDVDALLRQRYEVEGWSLDRLARLLHCRASTVRNELDRAGIERRTGRDAARRAGSSRATQSRQRLEARSQELGFPDVDSHLFDRRSQGWTQRQIAGELGIGEKTVRALLRARDAR